jgi:hypothetical protein
VQAGGRFLFEVGLQTLVPKELRESHSYPALLALHDLFIPFLELVTAPTCL